MKILFIFDSLPYPPETGPNFNRERLLNYISLKNECHVMGFINKKNEDAINHFSKLDNIKLLAAFQLNEGAKLRFKQLKCLLRSQPLFMARWGIEGKMAEAINAIRNEKYDVVLLFGLPVIDFLKILDTNKAILIVDDAVSLAYERKSIATKNVLKKLAFRQYAGLIREFEKQKLFFPEYVIVVSTNDAEYLRSVCPSAKIKVIPVSIPDKYFNTYEPKKEKNKNIELYLLGHLYIENIRVGVREFLKEVYPCIRKEDKKVRLTIVGKPGNRKIMKYINKANNIFGDIQYKSWVKDFKEELEKADIVIIPDLVVTGIQNRVVQAMALKKPVVGRKAVFENLGAESNVNCIIADNKEQFVKNITELINDYDKRKRIGFAAYDLVSKKFRDSIINDIWDNLLGSIQLCHPALKTGHESALENRPLETQNNLLL